MRFIVRRVFCNVLVLRWRIDSDDIEDYKWSLLYTSSVLYALSTVSCSSWIVSFDVNNRIIVHFVYNAGMNADSILWWETRWKKINCAKYILQKRTGLLIWVSHWMKFWILTKYTVLLCLIDRLSVFSAVLCLILRYCCIRWKNSLWSRWSRYSLILCRFTSDRQ